MCFSLLTGWEVCLIWNAQCYNVPPYSGYYRLILISIECKKKKQQKIKMYWLYIVQCRLHAVCSVYVCSLNASIKNVGVMINYMSITNKNSGILISELHVLWPLETALVFNNNEFRRKDVPWCCKNLNYE